MISKEEMYEFASQIAGITDADLEAYKCGGKTKKKAGGGNIFDKVKRAVTPINKQINSEVQKRKPRKSIDSFPGTSDEATKRQQEKLREEILVLAESCRKTLGEEEQCSEWLHNGEVCQILNISKET